MVYVYPTEDQLISGKFWSPSASSPGNAMQRNISEKRVYKNTTEKECYMIWHFGTSVQNVVIGRSEAIAFTCHNCQYLSTAIHAHLLYTTSYKTQVPSDASSFKNVQQLSWVDQMAHNQVRYH